MRLVVALLLLTGCIGPSASECANGALCPPGLRCVDNAQGILCVSPNCGNGSMNPNEVCDDNNNVSGDGCPADCSDPCGDGFRDPDEACDDANVTSGDGCSADCRSNETCGNGVMDGGEGCDDRALRSHDGCSSRCVAEQPVWRPFDATPSARLGAAMAFDVTHGRALLFGGCNTFGSTGTSCFGPYLDDVWEWDGAHWIDRSPVVRPPPRSFHAMAYDVARGELVVFGGCASSACLDPLSDTWVWDGAAWSKRTPATTPPKRLFHSMTYDAKRKRIVMFGGCPRMELETCGSTASFTLGDTWEWDGANWIESSGTQPPPRFGHALAFDPVRGEVVLHGGSRGRSDGLTNASILRDTWAWNGTQWIERATTAPARVHHTATFDVGRGELVINGGCEHVSVNVEPCALSGPRSDSYAWNGSGWSELQFVERPPGRRAHAAAYDHVRRRLVVFGGASATSSLRDTWELDGTTWIDRFDRPHPGPMQRHAMAFDRARGVTVLFAGSQQTGPQTWELDRGVWRLRTTPTSPSLRDDTAMAYDAGRGVIVLYGGFDSALRGDTWEWDGTSWTLREPTTSPPQVRLHAMAYDAERGRVVLFGGCDIDSPCSGPPYFGETWLWDGTSWTRATPAVSPPGRAGHAMAYDSVRERVVMFGGETQTTTLADTWEWDGTTWIAAAPMTSPPARTGHAMAYDVARDRIAVLAGCGTLAFNGCDAALDDLWTWNGTTWTAVSALARPSKRWRVGAAYDDALDGIVMFGGAVLPVGSLDDTWLWNGTWQEIARPAKPSARLIHQAMAYDSGRGATVLFGGEAFGFADDTWEHDENGWRRVSTAVKPSARRGAVLAYDAARKRTVLFGGTGLENPTTTWEWDGVQWLERTGTAPPPRFYHAMAYDSVRERVVLFGGLVPFQGQLADTWEWDGTSWTAKTPVTSPPARHGHALAFDATRKTIVLFGGATQTGNGDDTWEWDGVTWTQRMPATKPSERSFHGMAYSADRGSVIVFGGSGITTQTADSWEWNGTTWTALTPASAPPARTIAALVYDATRRAVILFGGAGAPGSLSDTWALQLADPSVPAEACRTGFDGDANELVGCADATCVGYCATCGDGACAGVEDCRVCPGDCGACNKCGDGICDAGETCTGCPGDCGVCP